MDISFLDLRKKPGRLLAALERREKVTLSRRGKPVARVLPLEDKERGSAAGHPAFGLWADHAGMQDVAVKVRDLRRGRFDAL
ncbi:MAG: type II toxin-antitoxin system prevent-host-death family antitoxin [Thermodesulfobacteriota bacterium]